MPTVERVRIGIDLGGTKIEGIALASDGSERARLRVATPQDYAGSVEAIGAVVSRLEAQSRARGSVGVGIPGSETPEGVIKNANSTWLIGAPFRSDLEAALDRPVRMMNDANCFAISEAADGAGLGADVVFGVILGTGVGGGVVVRGRCVEGPNRIAGEWGHNPLPWARDDELPAARCYCGRDGCIETYLSGPGLERWHARRTGSVCTTREIVARAAAGEDAAVDSLSRYHDQLGRALASVVNVLDPDVIVLGGGMSNLPDLAARAASALADHAFSPDLGTRVVPNLHGDSSGVRGAAWLWPVEP